MKSLAPFVLRGPGIPAGRSDRPARQIDLLPTLLPRLGLPTPPTLPGRDLLAEGDDDEPIPLFFERDLPLPFRQRALRLGDHKLVVVDVMPVGIDEERAAPGRTGYKPRIEPGSRLYDLARDPAEQQSSGATLESSSLLRPLLDHFDEGIGPENRVEVDDELVRKLRALGYLQ